MSRSTTSITSDSSSITIIRRTMSSRAVFLLCVMWLDPTSLVAPRRPSTMLVGADAWDDDELPSWDDDESTSDDGGEIRVNPTNSKLMIHIPHSLFKEEGYDHRDALFGIPEFGGSIAQNVYYAESTFCDEDSIDRGNKYPATEDGAPWPSPYILMVNRGDCTFVKKVRNAQKYGAAAVLIADNTCLCSDPDCDLEPDVMCEDAEPIMADDGSGRDISIPSFLMFKKDSDKIKDELKEARPVQVEMKWSLPAPDSRVEYDLWTTPSDKLSVEFLRNFKDIAVAFGKQAYFTPHQYIYDGERAGCHRSDGESDCYTLCTNKGRYCASDPDDNVNAGISGADVVTESLRRLCIWNHYGATDGIGVKWWDYVNEFMDRCNEADYYSNQDCINDAYEHAGVDDAIVEQCMKDSGDVSENVGNNKLDGEISEQEKRGVVILPSAYINTVPIRGELSSSTIFTGICAGFADGTAPEVCDQCLHCPDAAACVRGGGVCQIPGADVLPAPPSSSSSSSESVSKHTFATSLLFVVALFVCLGVWHYRNTRDDMRNQVRGILAEYMPLEDQDGGSASSGAGSGFVNVGGFFGGNSGGGGVGGGFGGMGGSPMNFSSRGGTDSSLLS